MSEPKHLKQLVKYADKLDRLSDDVEKIEAENATLKQQLAQMSRVADEAIKLRVEVAQQLSQANAERDTAYKQQPQFEGWLSPDEAKRLEASCLDVATENTQMEERLHKAETQLKEADWLLQINFPGVKTEWSQRREAWIEQRKEQK